MYLKVNGTRLFFDVVGSSLHPVEVEMKPKPTVIALHGGHGFTDHFYARSCSAVPGRGKHHPC